MSKKGKFINLRNILSVVFFAAAALLFICLRSYTSGRDITAPVITVSEGKMEYTEGEDESLLLQGVSAADDVDGDVTETVRVRSIYFSGDTEEAIVTYIAKDKSNNMGVVRRVVTVHRAPETSEPVNNSEGGQTGTGN